MLVDSSTDPSSKQLTANKNDAVDAGILHHHSSGKPQVSSAHRHQRLLDTKAGSKPAKNMHKKIRELEMKLQAKEDELDNVKAELAMCQGEEKDGNDKPNDGDDGGNNNGGGFGATDVPPGFTCRTTSDCTVSNTVCCGSNTPNAGKCLVPDGKLTLNGAAASCCSGNFITSNAGRTYCGCLPDGAGTKDGTDCCGSFVSSYGLYYCGDCLPDGVPVNDCEGADYPFCPTGNSPSCCPSDGTYGTYNCAKGSADSAYCFNTVRKSAS